MRKTLLIMFIILILSLSGLPSAVSINFNDTAKNVIEKSAQVLEIKLPKYMKSSPQSLDWYSFTKIYGIKIWARGWGTFSSKVIDENQPYYEFVQGKKVDETWRINIRAPTDLKLYYEINTFKYCFFDDSAETRTNSLITNFMFLVLFIDLNKPGTAENFRRNQKIPFKETGPHELSNGLIFNGTITKGQTYKGELRSSKMVDTDGDGIIDTECSYYEIVARCSFLSLVERNVDLTPSEFFKISLSRFLWWKDLSFIPYDC
jgi:hypothetical protein